MPRTRVVFYKEADGHVPVLEWLQRQPRKVIVKCRVRIERLRALGYELRRPEADLLRDGIHELRVGLSGVNYRILYFFHGNVAAVLANALTKEREVPDVEIERALQRRAQFLAAPQRHTQES